MSKSIKVLIVVDVQNCFLPKGTLSYTKDENNVYNFINSVQQLIINDKYNYKVFTLDSHPRHHCSFNMFGSHCVNDKIKCSNSLIDTKYDEDISSNGIELSTSLLNNKYLKNLKYSIDNKKNIFNMKDNHEMILDDDFKPSFNISQLDHINNYILFRKGEYCNYDSNSAFIYHKILNDDNVLVDIEPSDIKINYTTGLLEYLLYIFSCYKCDNIDIDICGLVKDICVKDTLIYGVYMCHLINLNKSMEHLNIKNGNTDIDLSNVHIPNTIKFNIINNATRHLFEENICESIKSYLTKLNINSNSYTFSNDEDNVTITYNFNYIHEGGFYSSYNIENILYNYIHRKKDVIPVDAIEIYNYLITKNLVDKIDNITHLKNNTNKNNFINEIIKKIKIHNKLDDINMIDFNHIRNYLNSKKTTSKKIDMTDINNELQNILNTIKDNIKNDNINKKIYDEFMINTFIPECYRLGGFKKDKDTVNIYSGSKMGKLFYIFSIDEFFNLIKINESFINIDKEIKKYKFNLIVNFNDTQPYINLENIETQYQIPDNHYVKIYDTPTMEMTFDKNVITDFQNKKYKNENIIKKYIIYYTIDRYLCKINIIKAVEYDNNNILKKYEINGLYYIEMNIPAYSLIDEVQYNFIYFNDDIILNIPNPYWNSVMSVKNNKRLKQTTALILNKKVNEIYVSKNPENIYTINVDKIIPAKNVEDIIETFKLILTKYKEGGSYINYINNKKLYLLN